MRAALTRARSCAPALPLLVSLALLIVACGAPAASTPALVAATPTAAASTPGPLASPTLVAATATPEPATTTPPATQAPVTLPPATAPPPSLAPGIGTTVQVGDQQTVTVMAFEQWPGTSTVKPRKGRAFMTVSIRVDAITTTSFDSADFKLRDAADRGYAWRQGRAPHLYSLSGMNPGSTYTGWVTYEVPKSALGSFELIYRPSFLPGSTYTIKLA